ncbi:MAG: hypothetical protein AAF927_26670 [Bacteroidota bacterium]
MKSPFLIIKLGLFVLGLTLFSCGIEAEEIQLYECRSGKCTYTFFTSQQIEIVEDTVDNLAFVNIIEGNNLVFLYRYIADSGSNANENDYDEDIFFEIDPTLNSFSFTDEQLAETKISIKPWCLCGSIVIEPDQGSLRGERLNDNTWEISFEATYQLNNETKEISFKAKFAEP